MNIPWEIIQNKDIKKLRSCKYWGKNKRESLKMAWTCNYYHYFISAW